MRFLKKWMILGSASILCFLSLQDACRGECVFEEDNNPEGGTFDRLTQQGTPPKAVWYWVRPNCADVADGGLDGVQQAVSEWNEDLSDCVNFYFNGTRSDQMIIGDDIWTLGWINAWPWGVRQGATYSYGQATESQTAGIIKGLDTFFNGTHYDWTYAAPCQGQDVANVQVIVECPHSSDQLL